MTNFEVLDEFIKKTFGFELDKSIIKIFPMYTPTAINFWSKKYEEKNEKLHPEFKQHILDRFTKGE